MRLVHGRTLLLAACMLMIASSGLAGVMPISKHPGNGAAIPNGQERPDAMHLVAVDMASVKLPDGSDSTNLLERSLLGGLTLDGVNSDGPDPKSLLLLGLSVGLALNVFRTPRPGR